MRHWPILALPFLAAAAALCAVEASAHKERAAKASAGLSDPQAYVDAHNRVRAAVPQPAGYARAWTPPPPIAWSDEVATGAQDWANHLRDERQCKLEHSDTREGENLAVGKDLDVAHAVQMWADEGKHYTWSPVYEFEIPTGHYTQVVWRKTTQLGCGFASCGSKVIIVCRYTPPGNHIGAAPY